MLNELERRGYQVVREFPNIDGLDFCKFIKNGHTFEIMHCFVRNGKQNKYYVKMDGKLLASRCLLYEVINKMEIAANS